MTILKCNIDGCTYEASHKRAGYAAAMLGRHRKLKHGIAGNSKPQPKPKPQAETAPMTPEKVTPNFCPNCGCNLRVVTAALNLRRA